MKLFFVGFAGLVAPALGATETTAASQETPPPATDEPAPIAHGLDSITQEMWNEMFPHIGDTGRGCDAEGTILSYDAFIEAAAQYPAFGNTGTAEQKKQEVAAFLGQTSQETSGWWDGEVYEWGYCYVEEVNCRDHGCPDYCQEGNTEYPCVAGQSYHGRGPIQISHNYNYGLCGDDIYNEPDRLLQDPSLVLSDGVTSFHTALWFWFTPQYAKPSCHDVMVGIWEPTADDEAKGRYPGLGMTTNIINGGIECNMPTPQSVENRVQYYTRYCDMLDVSTGDNLYCDNMQSYEGEQGGGDGGNAQGSHPLASVVALCLAFLCLFV